MGFIVGGGIGFDSKPFTDVPPFPLDAADNGLSVDPVTLKIVLGGSVGSPASLLSDRQTDLNGNSFEFTNGFDNFFFLDPTNYEWILGNNSTFADPFIRGNNTADPFIEIDTGISAIPSQARVFLRADGAPLISSIVEEGGLTGNLILRQDELVWQQNPGVSPIDYLYLNPLNNEFFFGDFNGNTTPSIYINSNGVNNRIVMYAPDTPNEAYLELNGSNSNIFSTVFDGTSNVDISHTLSFYSIGAGSGLITKFFNLDFANNNYAIGDIDNQFSGNQFLVDDASTTFAMANSLGNIFIANTSNWTIDVGDIDANANGGKIQVDDVNNLFRITNTALTMAVEINGSTGFTGTVTPVNSITVVGGIVTNVT